MVTMAFWSAKISMGTGKVLQSYSYLIYVEGKQSSLLRTIWASAVLQPSYCSSALLSSILSSVMYLQTWDWGPNQISTGNLKFQQEISNEWSSLMRNPILYILSQVEKLSMEVCTIVGPASWSELVLCKFLREIN